MSAFHEYQRRQDESTATQQKSERTGLILIIIGTFIVAFGLPLLLLLSDDSQRGCEDIGGTYEVVGQEYSPALKHTIDVYGCVKQ